MSQNFDLLVGNNAESYDVMILVIIGGWLLGSFALNFLLERSIYAKIRKAKLLLQGILQRANVCESHGYGHGCTVFRHAKAALSAHEGWLSWNIWNNVLLAALLHDADDRKFFPEHKNYENAHAILTQLEVSENDKILILRMIDLVSTSKWGDKIPAGTPAWMLYPRYADRIEAVGSMGIKRCYQYTITSDRPLYVKSTARARTHQELRGIATPERYAAYEGESSSMIDHYYDKLLHIGNVETHNSYLNSKLKQVWVLLKTCA